METFGKQVLITLVVFAAIQQFTVIASTPDFEKALELVVAASQQPGNIDYASFCKTTGSGAAKLGCQIRAMDDVGLLVCLTSDVCEGILTIELDALKKIGQAKLNVLDYYPPMIHGLKCGARGSKDVKCLGYLVKWVPGDQGKMESIRSSIMSNSISNLVGRVRVFQPQQQARLKTGDDLQKILYFMKPSGNVYNRICDLQGFFMKTGGFLIADPDGVQLNTSPTDTCSDPGTYPTTQKVIDGLTELKAGIIKK